MQRMARASRRFLLALAVGSAAAAVGAPAESPRADPRVGPLLRAVSAERIERDIRRLAGFGTRHSLSAAAGPARGIGAAQRWVEGELAGIAASSGGRLRVESDPFLVPAGGPYIRAAELTNTMATLPGSEPGRVLVVCAHLDSRPSDNFNATSDAPGANDDASGVAAVLELARVMAPHRVRATVLFLIVSGEEQGVLGSTRWAEAARVAGLGIEAVLNNDIIGNSRGLNAVVDDRHVRVFAEGPPSTETPEAARLRIQAGAENDSPSRQLARAIADAQRRYLEGFAVSLVFRRDRYLRYGDHIPFNERGYAAVRFTEMNEDWRHQHQDVRVSDGVQYGDLPQFVDFAYVAKVTQVNLAALAELGWASAPPSPVRLIADRLEPTTTLRWSRTADADRLGYEVVWRHTTAPDWEDARFVGDVGEVTLSLSKDEFLFAVRGVSHAGNRGLPVLALPALQ
jgi:hypothetical protein